MRQKGIWRSQTTYDQHNIVPSDTRQASALCLKKGSSLPALGKQSHHAHIFSPKHKSGLLARRPLN